MEKLGALWKGKTKTKETYLNGNIDGVGKVVIFNNGFKAEQKEGAPDYIVYKSEDRPAPEPQRGKGGKRAAANDRDNDDDL